MGRAAVSGARTTRHVALFRGINVGRAKRIAMTELRALLESFGYSGVRTLLNSGNVTFDGVAKPATWHARRIRAAVAETLGVDSLVIVKSAAEVSAALAANPLLDVASDHSRLLLAFTSEPADLAAVQALGELASGNESFAVGEHAAYLWCGDGILESPLATRLLKVLDKTGTTRNLATVLKIAALLEAAR